MNQVICPSCRKPIEITEALSDQLTREIRQELEAELVPQREHLRREAEALSHQAQEIRQRSEAVEQLVQEQLGRERQKLAAERQRLNAAAQRLQEDLERQVRDRLAAERQSLLEEAQERAKEELEVQLVSQARQLREAKDHLAEARQRELELLEEKQRLAEAKEALELEVQRRLDAERDQIRQTARAQGQEEQTLRLRERDKKIEDLTRQIGELQRKAEQGSQQAQGEVLELELEALLRQHFPGDLIEPVAKGRAGGDILHRVRDNGKDCGTILWESKRTKSWSDAWLAKLRQDQRDAKADLAAVVSVALPSGCETFGLLEGVWVTSRQCVVPLAAALRSGLIELSRLRRSVEGRQEKTALLYDYLTGPDFRHRVGGVVEAFQAMREDLERERAAMTRAWARRERQLQMALGCTAGMYGDLEAIAGAALERIEALCLPGPEVAGRHNAASTTAPAA